MCVSLSLSLSVCARVCLCLCEPGHVHAKKKKSEYLIYSTEFSSLVQHPLNTRVQLALHAEENTGHSSLVFFKFNKLGGQF